MSKIETMCLLTGKGYLPEWVADTLNMAVEETGVDIDLIINSADDIEQDPDTDLSTPRIMTPFHSLKERIEPNPHTYIKIENVNCLEGAKLVNCDMKHASDGIGVAYPDNIVSYVSNCDVAFHHMVGIIQGNILTAPNYGVLGFHHGDIRKYRGTPNAVWQYLNNEPTVGITLQRYSKKLDAGEIVDFNTVSIEEKYSLAEILSDLHQISIPMLAKGIKNIENNEVQRLSQDDIGNLYTSDEYTFLVKVRFLFKSRINYIIQEFL